MTRSFAQMQASFFSVGSDKHAAVFECCSGKRDSVFVAKFMYVILIHSVGDGARDEAYLLKEYTPPLPVPKSVGREPAPNAIQNSRPAKPPIKATSI